MSKASSPIFTNKANKDQKEINLIGFIKNLKKFFVLLNLKTFSFLGMSSILDYKEGFSKKVSRDSLLSNQIITQNTNEDLPIKEKENNEEINTNSHESPLIYELENGIH